MLHQRSQYDIATACERQMAFLPQIWMPQYRCPGFLAYGMRRYLTFLEMKASRPSQVLAPTYDIDVCWHAHMLTTRQYEEDRAEYWKS